MNVKRSLFFKSFVFTASMFAICFIVFGMTMLTMGRAFLVRERQENLTATAEEVKLLAEAVSTQSDLSSLELRMSLAAIARCSGEHIFLCDGDGFVVTSSDAERVSPILGLRLSEDVRKAALNGPYVTLSELGGVYKDPHYVAVRTLGYSEQPEGYVVVSYGAGGFLSAWSGFVTSFILVSVGVLALALLFQFIHSRRVSRPILEMVEAANRYAKGDYSARVGAYEEDDEVGTLTEAFNGMAESLENNENRRRDLVANVAHELRTPMTAISGFADGIMDGTIPPEQERHYLEKISSETKRLSRLVRMMLDASRLKADDPSRRMVKFDLCEAVVQTVLGFEERVDQKHLSMELDMPEDGLLVMGDQDALVRVVYNLVDNAIKFSDEGSEIAISVWKENGRAYTCVQNHGATIPSSELPLIFDRFHKSDRSRSLDKDGVGLGLNMVKEIIAAHRQEIFVTSEDGVTAFTFTLDLAENNGN